MTTRRATARRTSLEKHQDEVIALLLTGTKPVDVATKYAVARSSVTKFIKRHADRLEALQAVVTKQVEDYAIAVQVNRIATNDMLRNLLLAVKEARAAGGTGIETGLVVHRLKGLGSGKAMIVVDEYEIDPALVTLIDKLHNSTANELGQLPKGDGASAHASAMVVNIIRNNVPELGI